MRYLKLHIIIITLLFLLGCDQEEQSLFSRSQCIVEVELNWIDSVKNAEKQELLGLISNSFGKEFLDNYQLTPPSMSYKGEDNEYIYLQYREDCLRKHEITQDLLSRITPRFRGFVEFSVYEGMVYPGVNTIDVQGRSWLSINGNGNE